MKNKDKCIDYEVYVTSDYSQFKRLEGNRDPRSSKAIIESIKAIGYIDNPILVNEKMEVIDGQNRLEALKQLEMPVYYHIVEGIGADEAVRLNIGRSNWKTLDYVKSYAERGNESYQKLLNFHELSKVDICTLAAIGRLEIRDGGSRAGTGANRIVKGMYVMSEEEYDRINGFVTFYVKNKPIISLIDGEKRAILPIIAFCINTPNVNLNRFKKTIERYGSSLIPYTEAIRRLIQISDYYNRSLKDASRKIFFESEYREANR